MPIPFLNRCKLSPSLPTVHWVATIHSHHATRTKSAFLDAYAFGGHICSLLFSDELKIVSIFVYENNSWRFPLMTCHEVSNTSHGYFTYSFRRSRFGCLQLKFSRLFTFLAMLMSCHSAHLFRIRMLYVNFRSLLDHQFYFQKVRIPDSSIF